MIFYKTCRLVSYSSIIGEAFSCIRWEQIWGLLARHYTYTEKPWKISSKWNGSINSLLSEFRESNKEVAERV